MPLVLDQCLCTRYSPSWDALSAVFPLLRSHSSGLNELLFPPRGFPQDSTWNRNTVISITLAFNISWTTGKHFFLEMINLLIIPHYWQYSHLLGAETLSAMHHVFPNASYVGVQKNMFLEWREYMKKRLWISIREFGLVREARKASVWSDIFKEVWWFCRHDVVPFLRLSGAGGEGVGGQEVPALNISPKSNGMCKKNLGTLE